MSQAVTPTELTISTVIERVKACETLKKRDRQTMAASLRTFARIAGQPPETMPATLSLVRSLFQEAGFARAGISKTYWRKMKYEVMRALRLCGVRILSNRCRTELPPDWELLVSPLTCRERKVLLGFVRHCIEQGVAPHAVDQAVFDGYKHSLEHHSPRSRHRRTFLAVCNLWNKCRQNVPGWPEFTAAITHRYDHYVLPWQTFPASLQDEVEAWLVPADPLDILGTGAQAHLRPATAALRRKTIHRFASACAANGMAPQSLATLRGLVSKEALTRGFRFLLNRHDGKPTEYLYEVAATLHSLAKSHLKLAESELAVLHAIHRNFRQALGPKGMTPKNRSLLRQFRDQQLAGRLLELPGRCQRRFKQNKTLSRAAAVELESALAVEILCVAPVRLANLAGIRLDQHLVAAGGKLYLVIPRQEVKNKVDLEFELPASTVALLDLYQKKARPALGHPPSPFLFPGRKGGHRTDGHMGRQLKKLTGAELGVPITAHQFRHLTGFLYLKRHPGCYEVVRQLLGHTSITTTIKFYAGLEHDEALNLYDQFLQESRNRAMAASSGKKR